MSSTMASASRNTRSWSGQRGPTSASTPSITAVSVEIAMPHALAAGAARVEEQEHQAGHDEPAERSGSAGAVSARTPRSSPSVVSREISRPTLRKNSTIRPSFTQCRRSRSKLRAAEAQRERGVPELLVAAHEVRPDQSEHGRREEQYRRPGLGAQEGPRCAG